VPFIAARGKPNPYNAFQKQLSIPAGGIQSQVASVEDLYPTLLKLVGAENQEGHKVDGDLLQTLLTGEADDGFDAGALLIESGEQSSPCRRAHRARGMEVGQFHPFGGELVEFRCLEVGIAEATQSSVAHVVDHDEDQVGTLVKLEGKS